MKKLKRSLSLTALACLAFSAALASADGAEKTASASPVASRTLPLSIADIMRASLEIPADGIWAAEGADKLSEEEWQLADQDSVNLIVAASLVASAGTGQNDKKWVTNADWQTWVRDMLKTALAIRVAVTAMDPKKMATAADHLQELCEGCHTKYRPQTPTDGVSRYPFYPKRELAK